MIQRVSKALAKRENGEKGFTLIELLVVVIILGILAAIAIPVFLNIREGAWRSSVETDVRNAVIVVEQASIDNNGAVSSIDNLAITSTSPYTFGGLDGTLSEGVSIAITTNTDNTYEIVGSHAEIDPVYTYDSSTGSGSWADAEDDD